jgi:hypothetical protein
MPKGKSDAFKVGFVKREASQKIMSPWQDERDKDRSSMIASSDSPLFTGSKKKVMSKQNPTKPSGKTCDGCKDWMQSSSTSYKTLPYETPEFSIDLVLVE